MSHAPTLSPGDPEYVTGVKLTFASVEDFENRLRILQDAMNAEQINVLMLGGAFNHLHFTGLYGLDPSRPTFLIVPQEGQAVFVSPRIEKSQIKGKCHLPVAAEWCEWTKEEPRSFQEAVATYLRTHHLKNENKEPTLIGIDYVGITATNLQCLRNAIDGPEITDVSAMLRDVRRPNDAATINKMRAGADVAACKMRAIYGAIQPGKKEWEAALAGFIAQTERNGQWLANHTYNSPLASSLIIMGSGPERSANAHSVASCRVMDDGDITEVCCCMPPMDGHDICFDRPFRVGSKDLPEDVRKKVNVAREAQEAAIKVLKRGVTAGAVYAAAMKIIKHHSFEDLMQHGVGRWLGCGDAMFRFVEGDPTVLRVGDVVGIEPGVAGLRYGDTFLITERGNEALTPLDLFRYLE